MEVPNKIIINASEGGKKMISGMAERSGLPVDKLVIVSLCVMDILQSHQGDGGKIILKTLSGEERVVGPLWEMEDLPW